MAGALARALEMRSTAIHGNESGKMNLSRTYWTHRYGCNLYIYIYINKQYGMHRWINIYFSLDDDTDEEFEDEDEEDWD